MMENGAPVIDIVLPTYRMEPEETEMFYPSVAKKIADEIIAEELKGCEFDDEESKIWSTAISDRIREAVGASLSKTRYKIVVQTVIGAKSDQAIRVASRCLWDPNTDSYASCSYSNQSLFCTCMIFALYTD